MSGRRSDPIHHRDHHGDAPAYSLDELTSAAGVTVRTVRYYIAEGLLPPPVGGGPRTRYTRDHLDRLLLIGRLKDAYMPLKEIRRRLQAMSDDEIRDAAQNVAPEAQPHAAADAAAYINHVLRESGAERFAAMSMPPPLQAPPSERSWRRIPITDDAELLITEDAWDRRGDRIDAAVDWIRRILNEN